MTTYSESNAKVRYGAQFANGADHTDEKVRTRGLESFVSENAAKMAACRSAMGEASMAAAKLVNTINARLLPIAEQVLAERQKNEKAEAEKYGLAIVPSALSTALAGFVNSLRVAHIGDSGHKPSDMSALITLD